MLIDLATGLLGEALDVTTHWMEWFDADIAWGSRSMLAANVLAAGVLAPLFEEIAFRGLLYRADRTRPKVPSNSASLT